MIHLMRQKNEHEDTGEGVQNGGNTSTDAQGRYIAIEEGT